MPERKPKRPAINWTTTPMVTVFVAACPYCRAVKRYQKVRTNQNGDESVTKRVICKVCGGAYQIIEEPLPTSGNYTIWPT